MSLANLICNCCGQYIKGKQWWNRDEGYGICKSCGEEQADRYGLAQVELDNGKKGIHWGVTK